MDKGGGNELVDTSPSITDVVGSDGFSLTYHSNFSCLSPFSLSPSFPLLFRALLHVAEGHVGAYAALAKANSEHSPSAKKSLALALMILHRALHLPPKEVLLLLSSSLLLPLTLLLPLVTLFSDHIIPSLQGEKPRSEIVARIGYLFCRLGDIAQGKKLFGEANTINHAEEEEEGEEEGGAGVEERRRRRRMRDEQHAAAAAQKIKVTKPESFSPSLLLPPPPSCSFIALYFLLRSVP